MAILLQKHHRVEVVLEFTPAEIEILVKCAKNHYDAVCRNVAEVGGVVYGMQKGLEILPTGTPITCFLTSSDLDVLCKTTGHWYGQPDVVVKELNRFLQRTFTAVNAAYRCENIKS